MWMVLYIFVGTPHNSLYPLDSLALDPRFPPFQLGIQSIPRFVTFAMCSKLCITISKSRSMIKNAKTLFLAPKSADNGENPLGSYFLFKA